MNAICLIRACHWWYCLSYLLYLETILFLSCSNTRASIVCTTFARPVHVNYFIILNLIELVQWSKKTYHQKCNIHDREKSLCITVLISVYKHLHHFMKWGIMNEDDNTSITHYLFRWQPFYVHISNSALLAAF